MANKKQKPSQPTDYTVDAVYVVRCKDCKHYKPQHKSAHWNNEALYCCRCATVKVKPDDFCSHGERRNNG